MRATLPPALRKPFEITYMDVTLVQVQEEQGAELVAAVQPPAVLVPQMLADDGAESSRVDDAGQGLRGRAGGT